MVEDPYIRKSLYKLGTIINIESQRDNKIGRQCQDDTQQPEQSYAQQFPRTT